MRQEWDSIICCDYKPQRQVLGKNAKRFDILAEKRQFWQHWLILMADYCISSWQPKKNLIVERLLGIISYLARPIQASWTNIKSAASRSGVSRKVPKNIAIKGKDESLRDAVKVQTRTNSTWFQVGIVAVKRECFCQSDL